MQAPLHQFQPMENRESSAHRVHTAKLVLQSSKNAHQEHTTPTLVPEKWVNVYHAPVVRTVTNLAQSIRPRSHAEAVSTAWLMEMRYRLILATTHQRVL